MPGWLKCLFGYHDWRPTTFFSAFVPNEGFYCRRCNVKRIHPPTSGTRD